MFAPGEVKKWHIEPCPRCRGIAEVDIHSQMAPRIVCKTCGHDYLFPMSMGAYNKAIDRWNGIPREVI